MKEMSFETKCICEDTFLEFNQEMKMVFNPVYFGSTVIYKNYEEYSSELSSKDLIKSSDIKSFAGYGRSHNPTILELEKKIASLEFGDFAKITSSGVSAISTAILAIAKFGEHILITDGAYGGTRKFVEYILPRYGITYDYYDPFLGIEDIKNKTNDKTSIIFCESPSSGSFEIQNLEEIANFAKSKGITTICDNTMMTPMLLNPLKFGIDIVIHSLTKFVLGYSDCMLGAIVAKEKHFLDIHNFCIAFGNHVSSDVAYMALRGIKTLPLRINDSIKRGLDFIEKIKSHKLIEEILHPSRKNQNSQYVGLFTLVLKEKLSEDELKRFFNNLKIFKIGYSWGGFESLCTKCDFSKRTGEIQKYNKKTCLRLYIGMENISDLTEDINNSLNLI